MRRAGITGPAGSGKTTLFRAVGGGAASGDIATVDVPDERLDKLVELHASRKRVAAQIEVVDVHAGARTPAAGIARLREMDALLVVAGAFSSGDTESELRSFLDDLILADLGPVENRLVRAKKDPAARGELPTLERAKSALEEGKLLREIHLEAPDLQALSSIAPITLKPLMVAWNVEEAALSAELPDLPLPAFSVSATLEAELAGVPAAEARDLLEAYGVTQPVTAKLIAEMYRSFDLITFFTTSDKESRAWAVRSGATAPEAAGVIHSDLQRGFIRAEVAPFEKLVEAGSWDASKAKGYIRIEGKDYVFKEGDVTHFRFAV